MESIKFSDWRNMYRRYTEDLMIKYYEERYSREHYPIKVIVLSKNESIIIEILHALSNMGKNLNIEFIFANEDNSSLCDLINEFSGKKIDLSLDTISESLRKMEGTLFASNSSNKVYLPCHSSKGKSIVLPTEELNSIKQYFQVIHLGILNEVPEQISKKSFYQGRAINWGELNNHDDVDREITKGLLKEVRSLLEKRVESEIVYLTHHAGVGGTTIARRVAFKIYEDFPVLFLNETISSYEETPLIEKLLKVFKITELPCLVVVDNTNVKRQQIEVLERIAGNRLAKTVFLLVESTFSEQAQEKEKNKFYIPARLEKKDANRFIAKFSEKYPKKIPDFQLLIDNTNTLNPFYFGLIANEERYVSIHNYVNRRLENISDKESDLLLLLAFCQIYAKGKLREIPHFVIATFLNINEEFIRLKRHTQNHQIYDLIIETDNLSWKVIHPIIADTILKEILGTIDTGEVDTYALKDFAIKLIKSLRTISDNRNEEVLELLHNLFILRVEESKISESDEADTSFSDSLYKSSLFSKLLNDLENNNNRIEVFGILTGEFPDENPHFWGHFSRLYSINKDYDNAINVIEKALTIEEDFIFYHIKGMCYRTELYRLRDQCWKNKEKVDRSSLQMKRYFDEASNAFKMTRELAPRKEHGYIAFIQLIIKMIELEYSVSSLKNKSKDYTEFIISNSWSRDLLTQATEVINDYTDVNQEFKSPKIKEKQIYLLQFFGEKDKMINAWNGLIGSQSHDQNLVRRQLAYAYLAKSEFDWEKAKGKDLKRIIDNIEINLNNKVEVRDLQLWFKASRRLNNNNDILIKKVQEWEFKKSSLDTAYFLMCLFGIQAIIGDIKSGVDNYESHKRKVRERISNSIYSKVFCIEWVGTDKERRKPKLLNHRQIGEWARDKRFFESAPTNLYKLKGKVVKHLSHTQGFIEIEGTGVEVMYQPGSSNHYSDDAQKGTKVEFYLGFNYDGARAFEVKNV